MNFRRMLILYSFSHLMFGIVYLVSLKTEKFVIRERICALAEAGVATIF